MMSFCLSSVQSTTRAMIVLQHLLHIHSIDFPIFLSQEGSAEVKYVEQYHFLSWPDMGIPEFPTDLLNLRRKLRRKFPYSTKAPILVHCR